jgi:alanyl-tRNA synthetase
VPGIIVHYGTVEEGTISQGESVTARVDAPRRADIQRNHTITHMLHRVLRDVVGDHVAQAGSLVAPDRMRFDFTHTRPIPPEQLHEIEHRLNAWVRCDRPVSWEISDYQHAIEKGAIALFGEKYGDQVRMVHVPADIPHSIESIPIASRDSLELCGGTHISRTGEIGFVRIINESSIGSGLRRIELLTGRGAEAWAGTQRATLQELAAHLGVQPSSVTERIKSLLQEQKQRQHELEALQTRTMRYTMEELLGKVQEADGINYLAAQVEVSDAGKMREMGDWLRDKVGSGVVVLGTVIDDKPQVLTMITPDLVQQGYHAGNLVKSLARMVGGGGGGRPDMAQAGGRDASQLNTALDHVKEMLQEQRSQVTSA